MDLRKIVVIVEDVEAARTALKWTLNNLMRYGDLITLLHVFRTTRSKSASKLRHLRLNGYQLALSFKDLCTTFPNTKVEIIVTEGGGGGCDEEGRKIAAVVREIGASVLVVGLHDRSFLYKMAVEEDDIARNFKCKVLAIKSSTEESQKTKNVEVIAAADTGSSTNMDFSQIEIAKLQAPEIPPQKIPYRICPDPSAIIWRSKRSRTRWTL
ncbi:uncharacterized protein LOC111495088 [Cucurbita maxima]|uniref:Uncharacterized protein LOC111495088 n=1 Tax=Cucurbita maxima TaxID=3661 RepID=A0A6J1KNG3_CUCMA|nr:uncharacterized protein LOC111495088 [Cucurbita maxima]XP_023000728.1 uncharacterized protein LOC111495088 [Cucurbita maxima]